MKRNEKIAKLKAEISILEKYVEAYKKAVSDLKYAEELLFDIGEFVKVTETCKRGCCIEYETEGIVSGVETNGLYIISLRDGTTKNYVSGYDMKRIKI